MIIHWAHVDQAGRIVSWGTASGMDVFRQPLADGLTCVPRPEHVNGFDGWRFINDQWEQMQ